MIFIGELFFFSESHRCSNSWGPRDDGLRKEGPNTIVEKAILAAIEKGRGGLGYVAAPSLHLIFHSSLYMWAAGNGRQNGDNCNYDGYANSRYVVTVGAVTDKGTFTTYSEPCSALIGVLPSGSGGYVPVTSNQQF